LLLFVELVKKFQIIVLSLSQEFRETLSFCEQLLLRFDKHLFSESLDHFVADAPLEYLFFSFKLLYVKLIGLLQVVNEVSAIHNFLRFSRIKSLRLLQDGLLEINSREPPVMGEFLFAQIKINLKRTLELLWVNRVVSNSLLVDLLDDGLSGCLTRWLEHNLFEYFESLVFELSDRLHLYVVPVKILKEEPHPLNHNLVISPSFVQPPEELLAWLSFKIPLHVYFKVVFDRLGILGIQDFLSLVVLDSAEIIHDSKRSMKIWNSI
jgi:hypothetical protein